MDRRVFLKTVGAMSAAVACPAIASANLSSVSEQPFWFGNECSRIVRYNEMRTLVQENPWLDKLMTEYATYINDMIQVRLAKELDFKVGHYWQYVKEALTLGDQFCEILPIRRTRKTRCLRVLPPESIWKIQTITGKLIQYQQGINPHYDLKNAAQTNIVFEPHQIKHVKIDHPATWSDNPYGHSMANFFYLIEKSHTFKFSKFEKYIKGPLANFIAQQFVNSSLAGYMATGSLVKHQQT